MIEEQWRNFPLSSVQPPGELMTVTYSPWLSFPFVFLFRPKFFWILGWLNFCLFTTLVLSLSYLDSPETFTVFSVLTSMASVSTRLHHIIHSFFTKCLAPSSGIEMNVNTLPLWAVLLVPRVFSPPVTFTILLHVSNSCEGLACSWLSSKFLHSQMSLRENCSGRLWLLTVNVPFALIPSALETLLWLLAWTMGNHCNDGHVSDRISLGLPCPSSTLGIWPHFPFVWPPVPAYITLGIESTSMPITWPQLHLQMLGCVLACYQWATGVFTAPDSNTTFLLHTSLQVTTEYPPSSSHQWTATSNHSTSIYFSPDFQTLAICLWEIPQKFYRSLNYS